MAETKGRKKIEMTPRQMEIKKLVDKGRGKRSDQESARLEQLKMEERRDRFTRLAPKRVNNALNALVNVGRLGNRATYDYTDNEAQRIDVALTDALEDVRHAFMATDKETARFEL